MPRVWFEAELARRALRELRAQGVSPRVAACFGLCFEPELWSAHAEWLVPLAEYEDLTDRQRALCMLAGAALAVAREAQRRAGPLQDPRERAMREELGRLNEEVFGAADRERERQGELGRRHGYADARELARRLYLTHLAGDVPHLPAPDFARLLEPFMRAAPERFGLRRDLLLRPKLPPLATVADWLRPIEPPALRRGRGRPRK
ncbi:MAG: hypothetical protein KA217_08575 [Gammaproteobacteria bacterium]|nr:hypothetical protein [Gammaproteobacteria bacterium]